MGKCAGKMSGTFCAGKVGGNSGSKGRVGGRGGAERVVRERKVSETQGEKRQG